MPKFAFYTRKSLWRTGYFCNRNIDGAGKFITESWGNFLIPCLRLKQLVFGLRPKNDLHQFCLLNKAKRTRSQAILLAGSA